MKINTTVIGKVTPLWLALVLMGSAASSQQTLSNSVVERTPYCTGLTTNVAQGSDNLGCYYDVELKQIWTAPVGCNINDLPHGLDVEFTGATINTAVPLTGLWWAGSTQTPTILSGSNIVYWNKLPTGSCGSATNAIPSNQLLKVRIRVTPNASAVTVTVKELTGWSFPSDPTKWNCKRDYTFTAPTYTIGGDNAVCSGTAQVLSLSAPLPPGATITWYRHASPCPGTPPPAGWGPPAQIGGTTFPTNILTNSTCYVAVIQTACSTSTSNVRTITVCQSAPSATITATASALSLPLVTLDNEEHACTNWSGTLSLNLSPSACVPVITWDRAIDSGGYMPLAGNAAQIITGTLTLGSPLSCSTLYRYRATLTNACGTSQVVFPIVIDHVPDGGTISTVTGQFFDVGIGNTTGPILCYEMGTRLRHTTTCGKIKQWEYQEEITPCSNTWGPFLTAPGSQGTSVWFTNNLVTSRQYRALVVNGACTGAYSTIITVKVKPKLTVNITAPSSLLCTHPTLAANTSYNAPCNYTVASYQWYLNGALIAGATGSTFIPTKPGNYSVVVGDNSCGNAESTIFTICSPALLVTGPCCACQQAGGANAPVQLNAVVTNSCGVTPTSYLWAGPTGSGATGATTPSINVTQLGTYSVTVTWAGGCVLQGQITVSPCP